MLISSLAQFSRLSPFKEITIDDGWDQLNRSFMFVLMVICGTIVTVRQHTGNIISCNGFTKYDGSFSEDYCWTQGLYTIREAYHVSDVNVPYPGVIPEEIPLCLGDNCENTGMDTTRVYHLWYQWIPFYFWLAAAAFFLPYLIYKRYGFGDVKPLIQMLYNPIDGEEAVRADSEKASVWLYHRFSIYMNEHSMYANFMQRHGTGILVIAIKIAYLIISVLLMIMTSMMFELADFKQYGIIWVQQWPDPPVNVTGIKDLLFPKMVACEIKRWGPTGLEDENGMCVLAPNVINQYIFLILWWSLVLTIVSNVFNVLAGIIRVVFIYGSYRRMLASAFLRDDPHYKKVYYKIGTSGRVILNVLAASINPTCFQEIMNNVCPRLIRAHISRKGRNLGDDTSLQ
jgi:hypothetical protein